MPKYKTHDQMLKALLKNLTEEDKMYLCILLKRVSSDQKPVTVSPMFSIVYEKIKTFIEE